MGLTIPAGVRDENYRQAISIVKTKTQWGLAIAGLAALFIAPLIFDDYFNNFIALICINMIVVLGLNLLTGYCGQISLGQSAFVAVGAYSTGILYAKYGVPFPLATFFAVMISAVFGIIVGLPSVRLKGFYLALSTVAFQFIVYWLLFKAEALTGGGYGLALPAVSFFGITFDTRLEVAYLSITSVVILAYFAKGIARTRAGRAFIAIRDNDLAAEVMGIALTRTKLIAFVISSIYAGFAGALYALLFRFLMPDLFTLGHSVWYLAMVIVGGMGSLLGSILGTVFIVCLQEITRVWFASLAAAFPTVLSVGMGTGISHASLGLALALFLIFEPRGLSHRWETIKSTYRLWPFSY
jgi:branched-chain amino acid transport system permease protein